MMVLTERIHVRLPKKVVKMLDKAIRVDQEHLSRSDFIRGAIVRRLRDIGMWRNDK